MTVQKKRRWKTLTIRSEISTKWYVSGVLSMFIGGLIFWSILSYGHYVQQTFLPTPGQVFQRLFTQLNEVTFWNNVGISLFRILMGFLLASLLAIPLGILAGAYKFAEAILVPPTEFIRYMPATAFIPLIMVWSGIGETAKIIVIFIGCFFQLLLMVADNTRAVSNDLLQVSYTLGAKQWQVIEKVLIPALLPDLMNTLRLIIGWAWTYLVVAELVAASSGLGFSIMKAQRFLNTDQIFAGIIVIGLLGLLTDRIFAYCHRKFFPWLERR
ncbi:ABC transporter permease [Paenibacillus psychroresistens]|uniref:ABC transporter permease n=1 Tax=Paenibacillus psychroresistens TaxID=1778678 RepID=A0A6B8RQ09_9BACL|nr:ABC transporter permease [Paenibacillus psychroresistens]QGQ97388.1 ABC transporter permease [Paenibacillus psychroresistens]